MSREKQIEEQVITEMADDVRRIRESYFGQADYLFAKKLFEDGYRKQEWISVDERLPEAGTRVVGYDYESNVRCYFITGDRWWIDDGWNTARGWGITHWMPLPKAPKMKGGAE